MEPLEITTSISRFKDLDEKWLDFYDGVYLGDPFCEHFDDNLLKDKRILKEAVSLLKEKNKYAYISLPLAPYDTDFNKIEQILVNVSSYGIDAVEVYDLGTLRFTAKNFKTFKIHVANFVTIFNRYSAKILMSYNVKRIIPYPELTKDEIKDLAKVQGLEIELQIHGKIPLGYAEKCLIKKNRKGYENCNGDCFSPHFLISKNLQLKTCGRVTLSGKDICLYQNLKQILKQGYRKFRIESRYESDNYRKVVGETYRKKIESILHNKKLIDSLKAFRQLSKLSPYGFCNGYFFKKAGRAYVA